MPTVAMDFCRSETSWLSGRRCYRMGIPGASGPLASSPADDVALQVPPKQFQQRLPGVQQPVNPTRKTLKTTNKKIVFMAHLPLAASQIIRSGGEMIFRSSGDHSAWRPSPRPLPRSTRRPAAEKWIAAANCRSVRSRAGTAPSRRRRFCRRNVSTADELVTTDRWAPLRDGTGRSC